MLRRNDKSINGPNAKGYTPGFQTKIPGLKILIFTLERFDTRNDINPDTFRVSHRKNSDSLKIKTVN